MSYKNNRNKTYNNIVSEVVDENESLDEGMDFMNEIHFGNASPDIVGPTQDPHYDPSKPTIKAESPKFISSSGKKSKGYSKKKPSAIAKDFLPLPHQKFLQHSSHQPPNPFPKVLFPPRSSLQPQLTPDDHSSNVSYYNPLKKRSLKTLKFFQKEDYLIIFSSNTEKMKIIKQIQNIFQNSTKKNNIIYLICPTYISNVISVNIYTHLNHSTPLNETFKQKRCLMSEDL
jgi:hypothetical protein